MTYWILSFVTPSCARCGKLNCFVNAVVLKTVAKPDQGGQQEALTQAKLLGFWKPTYETKLFIMPTPARPVPDSRLGITLPTHADVAAFQQEFWAP